MAKNKPKQSPAFLFYPNDWTGGTMGMSFEEKGAYIHLLIMQFNVGHMTTRMIAHEVGQLWGQIQHKFELDGNGLWYNERLDEEKEKRQNYVNSRKNNKLGNNQHSKKEENNDEHMNGHMTSHMENENSISSISRDVSNCKSDLGGNVREEGGGAINFSVRGIGSLKVNIAPCTNWQYEQIRNFLTQSENEFQTMAIRKQELKKPDTFQVMLQDFISMIQEQGDYKSDVQEYRKYFSNCMSKPNNRFAYTLKISTTTNSTGMPKIHV